MTKEYQSIIKNDIWEIVPNLEGKSVVSSKWIYKIKHIGDGSIEKCKETLWPMDSLQTKESIMKIHFLL